MGIENKHIYTDTQSTKSCIVVCNDHTVAPLTDKLDLPDTQVPFVPPTVVFDAHMTQHVEAPCF